MKLVPVSNSEPLREYNPCHDPASGKFATRSAGRCAPVAQAIRQDAAEYIRAHRRGRLSTEDSQALEQDLQMRVKARRLKFPWYLRSDVERARRDERAIVIPVGGSMATSAHPALRQIYLNPDQVSVTGGGKAAILSALRHEIGHVSPERLGREAVVAGVKTQLQWAEAAPFHRAAEKVWVTAVTEEVRAWRNAIRAGRGRVHWGTVRWGIESHVAGQGGGIKAREASRITDRIMAHLKRYARMVRFKMRKKAGA